MTDWYSIAADAETVHLVLRDDIGCGEKTYFDLKREVEALAPTKIDMVVNSTGGCSNTGLNLYSFLRTYDTTATICGRCYSAALFATMGARTIRITADSKVLVHSPAGYRLGTAEEHFDLAVHLEGLTKLAQKIISQRTEQPGRVVAAWLKRDTWFNAQQAVEFGLADEIYNPPTRSSTSPRVAARLQAAEARSDSEKLLRMILAAMPDVETTDPEELRRYVWEWLAIHVKQKTKDTEYAPRI